MKKTNIALLEGNRLLRESLAPMINAQPDMEVVFSSGTKPSRAELQSTNPHIVLLDAHLQGKDIVRMVRNVQGDVPHASFIVMDLASSQPEICGLVNAGVSGFIEKEARGADVLAAIRVVARGRRLFPATVMESLTKQRGKSARKRQKPVRHIVRVTDREKEIIALIARGLSNHEIARQLDIAVDTVKTHVHNILDKLGLHTRLEIASYVHREGLRRSSRP